MYKIFFLISPIDEGIGTLKAIAQINLTKNEIVEVKYIKNLIN